MKSYVFVESKSMRQNVAFTGSQHKNDMLFLLFVIAKDLKDLIALLVNRLVIRKKFIFQIQRTYKDQHLILRTSSTIPHSVVVNTRSDCSILFCAFTSSKVELLRDDAYP
uniref:Uncharacterized protein n=1 Tax=Glossina pallidipes TaxID=7398 RepID=A0A1B0A1F7_GLOPL